MILNEKIINAVKNWLTQKEWLQQFSCPFKDLGEVTPCRICEEWFPETYKTGVCPCAIYGRDAVVATVKEEIKAGEL